MSVQADDHVGGKRADDERGEGTKDEPGEVSALVDDSAPQSDAGAAEPAVSGSQPTAPRPFDLAYGHRWLLAALSATAGVIHLVMAPSHLGEAALEGVGFLVAGWVQLALAAALVTRPARWHLQATVLVNLVLIAVYVVSRTAGLPFGEHAGHAESVSFVDGACVAIEAVLILVAGGLLLSRGRLPAPGGALALVVPLAVVALGTAAIASPSARDHAARSHGEHGAAGDDHAAAADDRGLSLLSNGHQHGSSVVDLDEGTAAELEEQLSQTQDLIDRYPTVADAEADGYSRAGPFIPGQGVHYQGPLHRNSDGTMESEDIATPLLIFDGIEPHSPLAGFMYMMFAEEDEEPEGFAGPNDHWHYHEHVCITTRANGEIDAPFGFDDPNVDEAMCDGVDGQLIEFTGWMVHTWAVPGYESTLGTFSEINPALTCPDGSYYMVPVREWGTRLTACQNTEPPLP